MLGNTTLGDLIDWLEKQDPNLIIEKGFSSPHSDRGSYDELAFTPAENITFGEMLTNALSAEDKVFCGYKGGEYKMTRNTPVLIGNNGECGDEITPLTFEFWKLSAKQIQPEAAQDARELEDVALIRQFIEQSPTIYDGGAKGLACQAEKIHALDALARLVSAHEQGDTSGLLEDLAMARHDIAVLTTRADDETRLKKIWREAAESHYARAEAAEIKLAEALKELGAALDRQGQARLAAESKVAELTRQAERNASWIQTISAERDKAEGETKALREEIQRLADEWRPGSAIRARLEIIISAAALANPAEGTTPPSGANDIVLLPPCNNCGETEHHHPNCPVMGKRERDLEKSRDALAHKAPGGKA